MCAAHVTMTCVFCQNAKGSKYFFLSIEANSCGSLLFLELTVIEPHEPQTRVLKACSKH